MLLLLASTLCVRAADIAVILPSETALTREFVSALSTYRPNDRIEVYQLDQLTAPPQSRLIITMGMSALTWRAAQKIETPTIATYVSRSSLNATNRTDFPASIRILLANPSPERQLRLAKLLMPRLAHVGMLINLAHADQLPEWEDSARRLGLQLTSNTLDNDENPTRALARLLDTSDLLVAPDDPLTYNADSLKSILLTSYSRNKVLIGPSAPYINAGSLSTTFSTPEQMVLSSLTLLEQPSHQGQLHYPALFSVISNQQVARSLGLPPPDDNRLRSQLARQEVPE